MIRRIYHSFKIIRKLEGEHWVKTKERGWITMEAYKFYLGYKYDPIFIKEENYQK